MCNEFLNGEGSRCALFGAHHASLWLCGRAVEVPFSYWVTIIRCVKKLRLKGWRNGTWGAVISVAPGPETALYDSSFRLLRLPPDRRPYLFHSPVFKPGTIISDEGFRVTLKTRYQLEYEDGQGISVSLNYDAVFPEIDILTLSVVAFRGDAVVPFEPVQQAKMFDNIASALQWKGFTVHFVESS